MRLDDATVRALVDVYEYARSSGDNGIYEPGSQGRRRIPAEQVRALAADWLAMRAVLEALEWHDEFCAACDRHESAGHTRDCRLDAVLAASGPGREGR